MIKGIIYGKMFSNGVIALKNYYECCMLCPRECKVNRNIKKGYCKSGASLVAARAALHMWEEPCISGKKGSGTVFFSGCQLGCVYCQNYKIRDSLAGKEISLSRLAQIFMQLQDKGANNINLVTPTHFTPHIKDAIILAKEKGLSVPVIYNCGGYEKVETLKMLDGQIDIYLPDFKYMYPKTAASYSNAPDYPQYAKAAIAEMVRQTGKPRFNKNGIMQKGVIVRCLLLPGCLEEAKETVKYLYDTYKNKIFISLMNQYTPVPPVKGHPVLGQKVSQAEYDELVDYAVEIGVENGFIQEGGTVSESFIPSFDNTGI